MQVGRLGVVQQAQRRCHDLRPRDGLRRDHPAAGVEGAHGEEGNMIAPRQSLALVRSAVGRFLLPPFEK